MLRLLVDLLRFLLGEACLHEGLEPRLRLDPGLGEFAAALARGPSFAVGAY